MNDRALALSILREARDVLAQRLTERILEVRDELLDDAHGLVYAGEIDALYEQLAVRLNHVNVMLSNLPASAEEPGTLSLSANGEAASNSFELSVRPDSSCFQADTSDAASGVEFLADTLADTLSTAHEATALPAPITFEQFARQIASQEIEAAGRSLAVLFAVDITLGCRCATTFYTRYLESPDVVAQALRLRRELQSGDPQGP
ncbi:MAG: hypothetical protein WD176_03785, partial [Pirellulales bacterium]